MLIVASKAKKVVTAAITKTLTIPYCYDWLKTFLDFCATNSQLSINSLEFDPHTEQVIKHYNGFKEDIPKTSY